MAFVSTWSVADGETVILPIAVGTTLNISVNWGDPGHPNNIETYNITIIDRTNKPSHTYTVTGGVRAIRNIMVTGLLPGWAFNDTFSTLEKSLLVSIEQYGGLSLANNVGFHFDGCVRLQSFPTTGSLTLHEICISTFSSCPALTTLLTVDTRNVTDMNQMFTGCTNFNGDISNWDVRKVTNMRFLFRECTNFNGDISAWEVSNVQDMSLIFEGCASFKRDVSKWVLTSITSAANLPSFTEDYIDVVKPLFASAYPLAWTFSTDAISQGALNAIIPVTRQALYTMNGRSLRYAPPSFISTWSVADGDIVILPIQSSTYINISVDWGDGTTVPYNLTTDGSNRPSHTYTVAGPDRLARTVTVTGDLPGWNTAGLNNNIASLLVSIVRYGGLTLGTGGGQFINCSRLTSFPDTGSLTLPLNCASMFQNCTALTTVNLSTLNTQAVKNMDNIFKNCTNFNGDISNWNVANVQTMQNIFQGCIAFRRDISKWVLTSISNNLNAPAFTNDYINDVKPLFSTAYPNAWTFIAPVTTSVINNINAPNITYTMGGLTGLSLQYALPPFISKWSVLNDIVTLPISIDTYINILVNWGDGSNPDPYNFIVNGGNRPSHQYNYVGTRQLVTITITGELRGWSFATDQTSKDLLVSIDEYGGLQLANTGSQFANCLRLETFPDYSILTESSFMLPANCFQMFANCTALNSDLRTFDVENVIDGTEMFFNCTSFNGDVSTWIPNFSMVRMFSGCTNFTGEKIFILQTGNLVEFLQEMFSGCTHFNGDISEWDVSNVSTMTDMFLDCNAFRIDISRWVTDTVFVFAPPSFTDAYIAAVKPLFGAEFPNAWKFVANDNIIETVIPLASRYLYTMKGLQLIRKPFESTWNVPAEGKVTLPINVDNNINIRVDWGEGNEEVAFNDILIPDQPFNEYLDAGTYTIKIYGRIPGWSFNLLTIPDQAVSKAYFTSIVDYGCLLEIANGGNQFQDCINLASVPTVGELFLPTVCANMFSDCTGLTTADLNTIKTSNVTDMSGMFLDCTNFNGDISEWNVQNVTEMSQMFTNCINFTGQHIFNITEDNHLDNMIQMFFNCTSFNGDISNWDVQNVKNMSNIFNECTAFRQDISKWILTAITDQNAVPSFSADYILNVIPLFSTEYPDAWTFNNTISPDVINVIIPPDLLSLYAMDGSSLVRLPMVTTWLLTPANNNNTIVLPIENGTDIKFTVDWGVNGEGPVQFDIPEVNDANRPTKTYANILVDTEITISITGRVAGWIFENVPTSKDLLLSIQAYGALSLNVSPIDANSGYFLNCSSLTFLPETDNLIALPSKCEKMFAGCSTLQVGLQSLYVKNVTNMRNMFLSAPIIIANGLTNWDVQNVTDMSGMFKSCTNFNGDISNWDVRNVENMALMFTGCINFNPNLVAWNVKKVKYMSYMFGGVITDDGGLSQGCQAFTGYDAFSGQTRIFNIPEDNVVENMDGMFSGCTNFNADLSQWHVQNVKSMSYMFGARVINDTMVQGCIAFTGEAANGDRRIFNIPAVNVLANTSYMFSGCSSFNGNLSGWNVLNVTNMSYMFGGQITEQFLIPGCEEFTGTDDQGNNRIFTSVSALLKNTSHMFSGCVKFNGNLSDWNVKGVSDMSYMFGGTVSATNSTFILQGCKEFTGTDDQGNNRIFSLPQPVNLLNNTSYMFSGCYKFNGNLSVWNVERVTDMSYMFGGQTSEHDGIVELVIRGCEAFTGISGTVSRIFSSVGTNLLVTDMSYMFRGCSSFNGNVSGWLVNNVTNMSHMFSGCSLFNGNLSTWNVQKVTDMSYMFGGEFLYVVEEDGITNFIFIKGCEAFTGTDTQGNNTIFSLPTGNLLENTSHMFAGCLLFNSNLSDWIVQGVTDMSSMFGGYLGLVLNDPIKGCEKFTGTDTQGNNRIFNITQGYAVTDMKNMFAGCLIFNGDISGWDVENITNMSTMFANCRLFNGDLRLWKVQNVTNMYSMFAGCENFNGDLLLWNVQKVKTMSSMFGIGIGTVFYSSGCRSFTGKDPTTGISRIFNILPGNDVIRMSSMFSDCINFNGYISEWNVQNVTNMSNMFIGCETFNGNLSGWNVQNVSNMNFMFGGVDILLDDIPLSLQGCVSFTGFNPANNNRHIFDITADNATNVPVFRSMGGMFKGCLKFNGDISGWDVQRVTNMAGMFEGCDDFKRDVSPWRMTSIQNNAFAPTFTNAYITEVKPKFSTGNPDAWNFAAPVNRNVLNVILPENRNLYYIDRDLRLRLATDGGRRPSKFSQSVITRSYNTPIIKSYI